MSISALSSSVASAPAPAVKPSEEAAKNPATRAAEAAFASAPVKGAPAPGTGTLVDVSA